MHYTFHLVERYILPYASRMCPFKEIHIWIIMLNSLRSFALVSHICISFVIVYYTAWQRKENKSKGRKSFVFLSCSPFLTLSLSLTHIRSFPFFTFSGNKRIITFYDDSIYEKKKKKENVLRKKKKSGHWKFIIDNNYAYAALEHKVVLRRQNKNKTYYGAPLCEKGIYVWNIIINDI